MKIGLIDVDGHNFPNIPLMKLSAWHQSIGDSVEWYDPMFSGHLDKVYVAKVFSFTPDYEYHIDADEVVYGGSGYCISLVDDKEVYDKSKDMDLPPEIEHIYPDYSIYGITDTAYGFLSRGCPRGCSFCHVAAKEGRCSYKVADLTEFWNAQKNIVLCDPNILACKDWRNLLQQLIDSGARVDINQGLDIRLMTVEKAQMLKRIKMQQLHFAWDRYQDKDAILPKFKMFKDVTGINERNLIVYVLCNFDTTIGQDLERIYTLREMGYWAYVMLYDKEHIPKGHPLRKMARWVNNRFIFAKCERFEDYLKGDQDDGEIHITDQQRVLLLR
ncbi:MAG: radical SAM protein [Bacteroidaceae bacterium]|nr:radical SAM protein [Bacteroidaceae bacterium]